MNFKRLEIIGLRGFEKQQIIELATPKGTEGSGLTVIVGPNNSGKSTIYEAFRAISQNQPPSFTEGRRNKKAGDKILIKITDSAGNSIELKTQTQGGSETIFERNGIQRVGFFTLPSRRTFNPFFSKASYSREQYIQNSQLASIRGSQLDQFYTRLFSIQAKQDDFNLVLQKVLGKVPDWYIEQADNGQYYLKFNFGESSHNSDGIGEGLLSIFTIVDTLYDSKDGDLIFIDEPELSLHPSFQKKLIKLLSEYSKTRQIIINTHSPYFIDWNSIYNGGKINRTLKTGLGSQIKRIKSTTYTGLKDLLKNFNNPHILGLNAKELFFLEDNILLVEGQEDVIFLQRILELEGLNLSGDFFGWGMGGAPNASRLLNLFRDLGFKKVTVIFDADMKHLIPTLKKAFPEYQFVHIPADDIRDKPQIKAKPAKEGLIYQGGKKVKVKFKESISSLVSEINGYQEK